MDVTYYFPWTPTPTPAWFYSHVLTWVCQWNSIELQLWPLLIQFKRNGFVEIVVASKLAVSLSTFILNLISGPWLPPSLRLDVSFQCALSRLQLVAEVHARLSRPHLHLSIDGGATGVGPRWSKLSAPPPSRCTYWGCWERAAVPGSAHGGEKSSFSQPGCCSGELRSRRVEEEEGQTGMVFITNAISPVIRGL